MSDFNPFQKFISDMTEKRKRLKKEKKTLLQVLAEKHSNAVYGFSIRSDVLDIYK